MAHYVKSLVDDAMAGASDGQIAFFYRWKIRLERGEFVVSRDTPSEISVLDLLWQDYRNYDQLGHARLAFRLWYGVLCHPGTISAAFRVGGEPFSDRAVDENNRLLSDVAGPFKAEFLGGNQDADGLVYPQKGAKFLASEIPLEVGAVCPANLIVRLFQHRAFARWPYGSRFIYVFKPPYDQRGFSLSRLMRSHLKTCEECLHTSEMDFVRKEADIHDGADMLSLESHPRGDGEFQTKRPGIHEC